MLTSVPLWQVWQDGRPASEGSVDHSTQSVYDSVRTFFNELTGTARLNVIDHLFGSYADLPF